jgi:diaminopimelate epimerase
MLWPFAKYVGCGNDFILFDNRSNSFPSEPSKFVLQLCHRQWGIGADGVILLENSSCANFRMRIFNADGSEAEMCGNGIRCLAQWIKKLGFPLDSYQIETKERVFSLSYTESQHICVKMGHPSHLKWNIPLILNHQVYYAHYLDTGVPHAVFFVEDVEAIDLLKLGSFIRHHSQFAPKGTNVNFAQRIQDQIFKIRTYERGVEKETLACGTGATAVALAAAYQFQSNSPITIECRSQTQLIIRFEANFSEVTMTGPAHCTFTGEVEIEMEENPLFCLQLGTLSKNRK